MRERKNKFMSAFFRTLYIIFSVICGGMGWLFHDWRTLIFQLWYQVTASIWLVLAITAIVLLVKVCKLNNLKRKIHKWKE